MKLWVIVLTGLVFLLLADVAVLQARLQELDLGQLKADVTEIKDSLARLQNWEAVVAEEVITSPSPSATPKPTPLRQGYVGQKELYVPLGSGSTKSQEWVDVGGQAYIDTRQYQIKEAYFEASLKSNSGGIWARLVNKNEGDYIAGSEVTSNTSSFVLVRSGKIALSAGNKLYGIQLRSETQQEVFAENAKVRLLVQE